MEQIIQWSDDLSVGVPEIDKQHKKLVDILNRYYTEIKNKEDDKETIDRFLDELSDYMRDHLDYEEKFLAVVGYPELEQHKKVHRMFMNMYSKEIERARNGDKKALRELVSFTLSWLYTHIAKTDKKYAKFLQEKAVATV